VVNLAELSPVMPGLVPGIHVFPFWAEKQAGHGWRDKPGHDDIGYRASSTANSLRGFACRLFFVVGSLTTELCARAFRPPPARSMRRDTSNGHS
jgi:hypothetical protein